MWTASAPSTRTETAHPVTATTARSRATSNSPTTTTSPTTSAAPSSRVHRASSARTSTLKRVAGPSRVRASRWQGQVPTSTRTSSGRRKSMPACTSRSSSATRIGRTSPWGPASTPTAPSVRNSQRPRTRRRGSRSSRRTCSTGTARPSPPSGSAVPGVAPAFSPVPSTSSRPSSPRRRKWVPASARATWVTRRSGPRYRTRSKLAPSSACGTTGSGSTSPTGTV